MEEFYKVIKEFPNYNISNKGNVINTKTNRMMTIMMRNGYKIVKLNRTSRKIHRLIAIAFIPNPNNKSVIDHIDRNPLNNCIDNLRWVNFDENSKNRNISKNNKSGVSGVFFCNTSKKYRAFICINLKKVWLGCYENLDDAIKARLDAEKKHYGIYSPNFDKIKRKDEYLMMLSNDYNIITMIFFINE